MRCVIVRYTLKPECVAEHLALLAPVFEELARARPSGLRYTVARAADGLGFTHLAVVEGPANPLTTLASFKQFTRDAASRCEAPPQQTEAAVVGEYGAFS